MAKRQKTWVYSPPKPAPPKVPDDVRRDMDMKAKELIETVLKPKFVNPPPKNPDSSYVIDIHTKWYRHYFYFCSKHSNPGPYAISPSFESKFARLEYVGNDRFDVSYMRHTEQWLVVHTNLSVDQCLAAIKDDPSFFP